MATLVIETTTPIGVMALGGVLVKAFTDPGGVETGSVTTDAAGDANLVIADGNYTLTVTKTGWAFSNSPTHGSTYPLPVAAAGPPFAVTIWMAQIATRVCFQPTSKWIHRVCWLPGNVLHVEFKDFRGKVYFAARYPGVGLFMFNQFKAAASKGKWANAYLKGRPYIPAVIGS